MKLRYETLRVLSVTTNAPRNSDTDVTILSSVFFPLPCEKSIWDVSGFVRLFYILSKNKIFRIFGRHILDFSPIISRFS